jgi:hypothetical protein
MEPSPLAPLPKRERGMIAYLRILHRESGAKSSNRQFLPFLRFGGRGRGMGVSDHEPKKGKKTALEGGLWLDNHKC